MTGLLSVLSKAVWILLIAIVAELMVVLITRVITRNVNASIGQQDRPTGVKARRRSTLQGLLVNSTRYFIYFVALLMILGQLGVNWQPILAGAGVVGLAIGFGAQRLVRDIIAGLFILVEDQFAVGDYITVGTLTGEVAELGLRVTKIVDDSGRACTIANGDILQVCNYSRGPYRLNIPFAISAISDLQQVRDAVLAMGETFAGREDIIEGPVLTGPVDIVDGKLKMLLSAQVDAPVRMQVAAEMLEELSARLRAGGTAIN